MNYCYCMPVQASRMGASTKCFGWEKIHVIHSCCMCSLNLFSESSPDIYPQSTKRDTITSKVFCATTRSLPTNRCWCAVLAAGPTSTRPTRNHPPIHPCPPGQNKAFQCRASLNIEYDAKTIAGARHKKERPTQQLNAVRNFGHLKVSVTLLTPAVLTYVYFTKRNRVVDFKVLLEAVFGPGHRAPQASFQPQKNLMHASYRSLYLSQPCSHDED